MGLVANVLVCFTAGINSSNSPPSIGFATPKSLLQAVSQYGGYLHTYMPSNFAFSPCCGIREEDIRGVDLRQLALHPQRRRVLSGWTASPGFTEKPISPYGLPG